MTKYGTGKGENDEDAIVVKSSDGIQRILVSVWYLPRSPEEKYYTICFREVIDVRSLFPFVTF